MDLCVGPLLQPPIPKTFTKKLRECIPNVTFATNPCRYVFVLRDRACEVF